MTKEEMIKYAEKKILICKTIIHVSKEKENVAIVRSYTEMFDFYNSVLELLNKPKKTTKKVDK